MNFSIADLKGFLLNWKLSIALFGAGAVGLYLAIQQGASLNVMVFWVLGIVMGGHTVMYYRNGCHSSYWNLFWAWGFLIVAFVFHFRGGEYYWSLYPMLLGFAILSSSLLIGVKLAFPFAVLLVFLPDEAFFNMLFSYPLRVISGWLTAGALQCFGFNVVVNGPSLSLNNVQITITAACSGIEQLEAMLLIGYILALLMQKTFFFRFCHYLFILPSLILANVIRLTVTILLFRLIGDKVFEPLIHESLGYFMLFLCLVFYYLGGVLFENLSAPQKSIPPAADSGTEGEKKC